MIENTRIVKPDKHDKLLRIEQAIANEQNRRVLRVLNFAWWAEWLRIKREGK